jgi:vancomycin resistance protein VanJ
MSQPDEQLPQPRRRRRFSLRDAFAAISVCFAVTLAIVYAVRPDGCSALTVWPVLAWPIVSLITLAACLRRRGNRVVLLAMAVWALFACVFAEEPKSLLRFRSLDSAEWRASRIRGQAVRVASLNCAGGTVEAMREIAALHPDVILLQESPTRQQVEAYAQELFGTGAGVDVGFDTSIIVRGRLAPVPLTTADHAYFVRGTATVDGGPVLDVVSLRLTPACVRTDLYSPQAWRDHEDNRRFRRAQLQKVEDSIARVSLKGPVVLGGDFNAPQDDAVFDVLRTRLTDTFKLAGCGWGDTITNEVPVLRIDQIWTSPEIRPVAVIALKTVNSDHRMVVADLIVKSSIR